MEKVLEIRKCTACWTEFEITDKDIKFFQNISPVFNGQRYDIPVPVHCSDCRQQRRLAWRNERKLYKRVCDATWKNLISIFSPDKPYKVYHQDEWWSDKWDAKSYWREYDFSKTFNSQFGELLRDVPKLWILVSQNENSDYTNGSAFNKNCYLIFASDHNEDCWYCDNIFRCKDCYDCSDVNDSVFLHESVWCNWCTNWEKLFDCHNCTECMYCFDCRDCSDCFLCSNLRNKSFHFMNEQLSKEKYIEKVSEYLAKPRKVILQDFDNLRMKSIHLYLHWISNENCYWDYITNCKDSANVYSVNNLRDCKNIINWNWATDCQDGYVIVDDSSLVFDSVSIIWLTKWAFNFGCLHGSSDAYYTYLCQSIKNCFGCDWLKNSSYCILNKQYTKEEYEELVPKIIEQMKKDWEWWRFMSPEIAFYWYNETVSNEYYPISNEVALKKGFKWSDYENPTPDVSKIIPASKLPDNIAEIPDDIVNWAIECEVSGKPFRITKSELEYYRKRQISIPKKHPDVRHSERQTWKNAKRIHARNCNKCWVAIKSTFAPQRLEKVYCEKCYQTEVI